MHAAAGLSSHETIAQYWLMRKNTEAGDYKNAIRYADVMLRSNDQLARYVVPYLAHFADNQATIGSVKTLVDADPPWRSRFFSYLYPSVRDVRTPLAILLSLKTTPAPPTAEELDGYLTYLVQHGFYNLAYYAWLQFLAPEELQHVGLLYNGNFATPPSGSLFDWQITQGSGVAIDIEPADAGQQALDGGFPLRPGRLPQRQRTGDAGARELSLSRSIQRRADRSAWSQVAGGVCRRQCADRRESDDRRRSAAMDGCGFHLHGAGGQMRRTVYPARFGCRAWPRSNW